MIFSGKNFKRKKKKILYTKTGRFFFNPFQGEKEREKKKARSYISIKYRI